MALIKTKSTVWLSDKQIVLFLISQSAIVMPTDIKKWYTEGETQQKQQLDNQHN